MSDVTTQAMLAIGQAGIQWRQLAEKLEGQRNAAYADLAAAEAGRDRLRAALEIAELNTWRRATTGGVPVRVCRICDQFAYGNVDRIDHAPDCPFAALAGSTATIQTEGKTDEA